MSKKKGQGKTQSAPTEDPTQETFTTEQDPGTEDAVASEETGGINEVADEGETTGQTVNEGSLSNLSTTEGNDSPALEPETVNPDEAQVTAVEESDQNEYSQSVSLLRNRLQNYVDAMDPGLIKEPGECAKMQVNLHRAMTNAIGFEGSDFTAAMDSIIEYFRAHRKGAFSEKHVYRDIDQVSLSGNERTLFERLLRLFLVAADLNNVKDVQKHVDVRLVIQTINSNAAQQRMLEYFGVE